MRRIYILCLSVPVLCEKFRMGGNVSKPGDNDIPAPNLYCWYMKYLRSSGEVSGGCSCEGFFGGNDDTEPEDVQVITELKTYHATLAAEAKRKVVKEIARALNALGFKTIDPDAPLDTIVSQIVSVLPNPHKTGVRLGETAERHEKICQAIAKVLNDSFTPGATGSKRLIDLDIGATNICRAVYEYVWSMSTGIQMEFLTVHSGLKTALRNIEILDEVLRQMYSKISDLVDRDGDSSLKQEVSYIEDVYNRAQTVRMRQLELLKNFLSVSLAPAEKELELAMREHDESHKVIESLGTKIRPGSAEFGEALAMTLSGLGTAAAAAERVDRALRAVGLSIQEYLKTDDVVALDKLLDKRMMSGKIPANLIAKFLIAAKTLRLNFSRREEIAKAMPDDVKVSKKTAKTAKKARGGEEDCECGNLTGGDEHDNVDPFSDEDIDGGDDVDPEDMTEIDRRVRSEAAERNIIVNTFVEKTSRIYKRLLGALDEISSRVGKSVPVTGKLRDLRDAVSALDEFNMTQLEFALIGFWVDAPDREKRSRFMAQLKSVVHCLDELIKLKAYSDVSSYFVALRESIDELVAAIDFFADTVKKKYGGREKSKKASKKVSGGISELDFKVSTMNRSTFDLKVAVNKFRYFFYIANVYDNLNRMKDEVTVYGEKYGDVLGDAVAEKLNTINIGKESRLTAINNLTKDIVGDDDAELIKIKDRLKLHLEEEVKTKKVFYKALQAIDIYLKSFTDNMIHNPKDVLSIKKMLDGLQVIARWFNEDTGNKLAKVFDCHKGQDLTKKENTTVATVKTDSNNNYYESVAHEGVVVGVPQVPFDLRETEDTKNFDEMKKSLKEMLENFQALKNIINAFARIGDKFGSIEVHKQTFMSPNQIYKALTDFIRVSSYSVGKLELVNGNLEITINEDTIKIKSATCDAYLSQIIKTKAFNGNYQDEYRFFWFIIKAMAAKITTVIGVYNMFEKPGPIWDKVMQTRIIIGGDDAKPEAISEAAESYFRIPRLLEFYRNFLKFDTKKTLSEDMCISILAGLEGKFARLFRLMFVRQISTEGMYSDYESYDIIKEINAAYVPFAEKHGKDKANAELIDEIVKEINRRYGVVKKDQHDKYIKMLQETGPSRDSKKFNETDYAILPGEDEYDIERNAPADRFLPGGKIGDAKETKFKHKLDTKGKDDYWEMVRDFRTNLDNKMNNSDALKHVSNSSYSGLIKQARLEMDSKDKEEKLKIAMRLIQGSNSLIGFDVNKMIMFHETVVVGLTALTGITKMLQSFRARFKSMNLKGIRDIINTYLVGLEKNINIDPAAIKKLLHNKSGQDVYLNDQNEDLAIHGRVISTTIDKTFTIANLQTMYNKVRSPQNKEVYTRYAVNVKLLMHDLLGTLFHITSDFNGLVQVEFPNTKSNQIALDTSGLRNLIESLLGYVRSFLDMFRNDLPKEIIDKFEKLKDSDDKVQVGSLGWIEEYLMDDLLHGKRGVRGEILTEDKTFTLDKMSKTINDTFIELTKNHEYYVERNADGDKIVNIKDDENKLYCTDNYAQVIAGLVFYDATQDVYGFNYDKAKDNIKRTKDSDLKLGVIGILLKDAKDTSSHPHPMTRVQIIENSTEFKRHTMLTTFNQLVLMYLNIFMNQADSKIYLGLVDSFANGIFSSQIIKGLGYPDLSNDGTDFTFGSRGDPKPDMIMFASLVRVFKPIMNDRVQQTNVSKHLISTMSDVPLFMKELYRADLPAFKNLFTLLNREGEFLKNIIHRTAISLHRTEQMFSDKSKSSAMQMYGFDTENNKQAVYGDVVSAAVYDGKDVFKGYNIVDTLEILNDENTTNTTVVKARFSRIIDSINNGSIAIVSAIDNVLKELGDSPKYLQTSENFIDEYRSRYNKYPFMPLSSAMVYLAPNNSTNLIPIPGVASTEFKMLYGVRQVLGQPTHQIEFKDMPGLKNIVETFNTSSSKVKIENDRYLKFARDVVSMLRFSVSILSYAASLVKTPKINVVSDITEEQYLYSLKDTALIQKTIDLTESSYQDVSLKDITKPIMDITKAGSFDDSRDMEQMFNLIDMNIMPINIHALMRGVPMINIYNYAYTFETMVASMFGSKAEKVRKINLDNGSVTPPESTRDAFMKLLFDPDTPVGNEYYGDHNTKDGYLGLIHRIFRGDDSLGMGRPKFLSDQMFGKALFGNLYPSKYTYDEGGVGTSVALERGRTVSVGRYAKKEAEALDLPKHAKLRIAVIEYAKIIISELAKLDAGKTQAELVTAVEAANIPIEVTAYDTTLTAGVVTITEILKQFFSGKPIDTREEQDLPDTKMKSDVIPDIIASDLTKADGTKKFLDVAGDDADKRITSDLKTENLEKLAYSDFKRDTITLEELIDLLVPNVAPASSTFSEVTDEKSKMKITESTKIGFVADKNAVKIKDLAQITDGIPSHGQDSLTYLDTGENSENGIKQLTIGYDKRKYLDSIGKARFDTYLVRNLFFISNVWRVLRFTLQKELTEYRNVIAKSHALVNPSITEYVGQEQYNPKQYDNDREDIA